MYKVTVQHTDGTETVVIMPTKQLASIAVAGVVMMLRGAGAEPDQQDLDNMHLDEVNLILHMLRDDELIATITARPISNMSLH